MEARRDERTEGFSGAPRLIGVVIVVVILPGRVNSNRNRLEPLVTCFNVCGNGSRKLGGDVRVREHCGALLPAGALVCVLRVHRWHIAACLQYLRLEFRTRYDAN